MTRRKTAKQSSGPAKKPSSTRPARVPTIWPKAHLVGNNLSDSSDEYSEIDPDSLDDMSLEEIKACYPNHKRTKTRSGGWKLVSPPPPVPKTAPGRDHTKSPSPYSGQDSDEDSEEEDYFAGAMEDHHKYLESLKKIKPKKGKAAAKKSSVFEGCVGSYVIRCEDLQFYTWEYEDYPPIDIEEGGPQSDIRTAAFDFGFLEGTMLLAVSEETLDDFVGGAGVQDILDKKDDDNSGDEGDSEGGPSVTRKRKVPPTATKGKKPQKKKAKKAAPRTQYPRRIYFRIRGRETGEGETKKGEIHHRPSKGYLDFADDTLTVFKGKVTTELPTLSSMVDFEGFKIHSTPQNDSEDWNNFSQAAYELAQVSG